MGGHEASTNSSPDHPASTQAGPGFTHLHLHTEYSLLDGGNRIDKLMDRVKALGMNAVACTDHGNMFGAVAFYTAAKERGIKPILGVEAYVAPASRLDKVHTGVADGGYHLVLLAENNTGWQNLLYLCSEAYLTGFYYKPRIDRALLEQHNAGLIAINGHLGSEIGEHLLEYDRSAEVLHWDRAVESARWHARTFADEGTGPRMFVELQHHVREQIAINKHLVRLAKELNLPLVCDNDSHFLRAEDHDAHDTLICISTAKNKSDPDRLIYDKNLYVKGPAQMRALFEPYGAPGLEALDNVQRIADRCNVSLPIGASNAPMVRVKRADEPLPTHDQPEFNADLSAWYSAYCQRFEVVPFALPQDATEQQKADLTAQAKLECDQALRLLAEGGYTWRYGPAPASSTANSAASTKEHTDRRARLERELKILADKGISAYFLIVWDFVNWGRQRAIPANARGSGVGTMVGYVLGLSNACPVRYGLLFERFTDPDRSEFPDIDIDLCQDGRASVIGYVRAKYGHVAQIITFGTLKARAAVRDVGRVLEMPLPAVNKLAKLVPEQLGITLDKALEQEADLKALYDSEPLVKRCIDNARAIEGQARHASVHAAGVIVATRPLHEIVPLYRPSGTDDIVTQWDGPTCEKMGLLKMDFLGLRTLSVVERCKALINQDLDHQETYRACGRSPDDRGPHPLDLDRLDLTDQKVFEMFRRGDTTGVFQFESPGMRRLLIEMKPDRLEDLIAANALFRPGPMDLIPDYNRRKHGQADVPRVHDIVDRYTAETYGVMVYQEQVMQIVHGLGGIKLRDAYTLIKNISKKKHDKIEKERPKFVDGSQKQGLTKQQAEDLFELILKFAGYGFNKSHSTGYAIVAYQTAYLKAFYPRQYMAAFLTFESGASQIADWVPYIEDCRNSTRTIDPATGKTTAVGIEVRPPDVNLSAKDFAVIFKPGEPKRADTGHIRFGLGAIKGCGDKAIESILKERHQGTAQPFTSIFDFCERVPVGGSGNGTASGSVNKATIEALVKSGAFDCLHGRPHRAAVIATIEQAVAAGSTMAKDKASGQGGLFGFGEPAPAAARTQASAPGASVALARATTWSEPQTLAAEKETLGFYVSNHPLDEHAALVTGLGNTTTRRLRDKLHKQDERVVIAAMISGVRSLVVKTGKSAGQKMGIMTLEDKLGTVDCVAFSDCFARYSEMITPDRIVFVVAKVDLSRGETQLIAEQVIPLSAAAELLAQRVRVVIDQSRLNGTARDRLVSVAALLNQIKPTGEPKLVELIVRTEHADVILDLPKVRLTPTPELVARLTAHLGPGGVEFEPRKVELVKREAKPWERKRTQSSDE